MKGVPMTTQRAIDEADIRRRIDNCANALHAMDLEGVMALYAPDIVSFDIVPPLRYEFRDVTITVGDDVAFAHSLNRVSGTLQTGQRSEFWVRWTACFRKIDGNWLIVHDQVSVPVDFGSGRALLDLEP